MRDKDTPERVDDDLEEAEDGFTYKELERMLLDGAVDAQCSECGAYLHVEPDAEDYDCPNCDATGSVTSPLRKAGLI